MAFSDLVARLDASCLGAFGVSVTYQPQAGGSYQVTGIFEEGRRPEEATPGMYTAIFFRAADLPAAAQRGDQVTIAGVAYRVVDVDADAEGGVRLVLHKV